MRSIKFRAWDRSTKEYVHVRSFDASNGQISTVIDTSGINGDYPGEWDLEQYTGLKDKNATEIYEGDIIEFKEYVVLSGEPRTISSVVKWSEGDAAFIVGFYSLWKLVQRGITVIGNIHENSELLEARK